MPLSELDETDLLETEDARVGGLDTQRSRCKEAPRAAEGKISGEGEGDLMMSDEEDHSASVSMAFDNG